MGQLINLYMSVEDTWLHRNDPTPMTSRVTANFAVSQIKIVLEQICGVY
jgi:hypothetical protein